MWSDEFPRPDRPIHSLLKIFSPTKSRTMLPQGNSYIALDQSHSTTCRVSINAVNRRENLRGVGRDD
jgi:hypothetical protein